MSLIKLMLFDPYGRAMPNAPFLVVADGELREGTADDFGIAFAGQFPSSGTCQVSWRRSTAQYPADLPPLAPDEYEYSLDVTLSLDSDLATATQQRLHNLGYFGGDNLSANVAAFQADHGLSANGDFSDAEFQAELTREHNELLVSRPDTSSPPIVLPEEQAG